MILNQDQLIEKFVANLKSNGTIKEVTYADGVTRGLISKGNENQPVEQGDSVYFYFAAYIINGNSTTSAILYDTNIKSIAESAGINIEIRNFNPLGEIAGNGRLIAGVNKGLKMCKLNEESILVFNSDMGYGSQAVGIVPPYSPLFFHIKIVHIKKN